MTVVPMLLFFLGVALVCVALGNLGDEISQARGAASIALAALAGAIALAAAFMLA